MFVAIFIFTFIIIFIFILIFVFVAILVFTFIIVPFTFTTNKQIQAWSSSIQGNEAGPSTTKADEVP